MGITTSLLTDFSEPGAASHIGTGGGWIHRKVRPFLQEDSAMPANLDHCGAVQGMTTSTPTPRARCTPCSLHRRRADWLRKSRSNTRPSMGRSSTSQNWSLRSWAARSSGSGSRTRSNYNANLMPSAQTGTPRGKPVRWQFNLSKARQKMAWAYPKVDQESS